MLAHFHQNQLFPYAIAFVRWCGLFPAWADHLCKQCKEEKVVLLNTEDRILRQWLLLHLSALLHHCSPGSCHCTQTEAICTSQFRSLVKISSLARSSWFHSSSSFSCPFQLSLSCSFVLKAAEEEQSSR